MLYAKMDEAPGPERIVFDLVDVVPMFVKRTNWMNSFESDLTEVLELLPQYINVQADAEDGLQNYTAWVKREHKILGGEQDGVIYAGAIELIGKKMIQEFTHFGLYKTDGVCRYIFDGWLDQTSPVYRKVAIQELFEGAI